MEPVPAGPGGVGLQGPGTQVWGMPGPIPLRNGTGEGLGYHRRARGAVESRENAAHQVSDEPEDS